MTQQNNTPDLLLQWWNNLHFEGKETCLFDPATGELSLKNGKKLGVLNPVTGETVIQNLTEKYLHLCNQLQELETEWQSTEDKLKLASKIERINESLDRHKYIGETEKLLQRIETMNKNIRTTIEANYQAKVEIVNTASSLSIENNNWRDIGNQLKELQEQWKTIGYVDKKRNDELWNKLEEIRSRFFEEKRHHHEDIEKEMLQNLDLKMELVEKARMLAASEDWKGTSELFKQLLDDWKKTGRTIPEKNEQLWQDFIQAKNHFFERKRLHTENIKTEQEVNMQRKTELIEKAEMLQNSTDWTITANAFNDLMSEWKQIGPVPSEHSETLWQRFSSAKETFYAAKKSEAERYKQTLRENYNQKMALIERAEAIKNSTNWRETTDEMNQLLDEWKKIGHVGKEHKEVLWERFITARKHFYNRKDQDREKRRQQQQKNKELHLIQTKNFLHTLIKESEDETARIEEFRQTLNENIDGPKSDEIKAQLHKLIEEFQQKIKNREPKIESLKKEIEIQELGKNLEEENSADTEENNI